MSEDIRRPFSDVHRMGGRVVATLLHDPTVEGLEVALYMDGSASMEPEYGPRGVLAKLGPTRNNVEPQMRWMLEYLAGKDRNAACRVAYWATGSGGEIEALGEMTGPQGKEAKFPGPKRYGMGTQMLPVLRDYIAYFRERVKDGAKRGLAVIITDSVIDDGGDIIAYSAKVAEEITSGRIPLLNFVLVGVGKANEAQMEEICHEEYPGVGHLWCHRHVDKMEEMADLVAVLVDSTMSVADGGAVFDARGPLLKRWEGRLPAVLEFDCPADCISFILEVNGQKYEQPIPEEHGPDEAEHADEPQAPASAAAWRPRGHGRHGH